MLINNQPPAGEYRHNYVRLAFLVGTLLLFAGYVAVYQLYERGYDCKFIEIQFDQLMICSLSYFNQWNITCRGYTSQ